MRKFSRRSKGFTLLEILLVIAIIAILAAIVIIAINPGKQLAESRNAERSSEVNTILNAVYQYSVDNSGTVPGNPSATATEICATGGTCTGLIDLSELTNSGTYIVAMPVDPGSSGNGTGYTILKDDTSGRITVAAPSAERNETISVTR
ncbi:MAG TPA: prepilin-type N-terminal cleavage/methylation domain-containing protein [Patescibacteria group bacterium]|nr:prepilin-type N-terminal cleavage/methylation domain-containing protein [Patescibacteria group bacterium]